MSSPEGYLMISRKHGEELRLITAEGATVIKFEYDGARLRLAIKAPSSVKIYREELMLTKEPA